MDAGLAASSGNGPSETNSSTDRRTDVGLVSLTPRSFAWAARAGQTLATHELPRYHGGMAAQPASPATLSDLHAVPDDRKAHLIEGRIYSHARPRVAHTELAGAIYRELAVTFGDDRRGGPGGWLFLIEPELTLGNDVLAPDIAAWRKARLPRAPATAQVSIAPDWVCEVLSKSTESFDRGVKRRAYLRAEVPHLWYVQPEAKLIEVYRKIGDFYASVAESALSGPIALEPFAAPAIDLGELGTWADENPEE